MTADVTILETGLCTSLQWGQIFGTTDTISKKNSLSAKGGIFYADMGSQDGKFDSFINKNWFLFHSAKLNTIFHSVL